MNPQGLGDHPSSAEMVCTAPSQLLPLLAPLSSVCEDPLRALRGFPHSPEGLEARSRPAADWVEARPLPLRTVGTAQQYT